tara:strand:+ start:60 stop:1208 length:1149 start_codon:yes stop_codon:yes gene_type:complete
MDDILKEAIADAKALRATALENAKIALEEAFTPRLKNMLSQKIQSEDLPDNEEYGEGEGEVGSGDGHMEAEGEHEVDERMHDEDDEVEERMHDEDDKEVEERMHGEDDDEVEERMKDEDEEEVKEAEHMEDEGEHMEDEGEHMEDEGEHMEDEDMHDEDELDLESVIKELEEELDSSEVGDAENKEPSERASDSSEVGAQGPEGEGADEEGGSENSEDTVVKEPVTEAEHQDEDEDIDLEEVLKALSEEEGLEDEGEEDKVEEMQTQLKEYKDTIGYLREKLNEVNLLNAKLLFTNKLFRGFGLNNNQKLRVVEQFDRAQNLREIKLVYATLAESFKGNGNKKVNESKGQASKAVASTEPKKEVLSEGQEMKNRFKKLANLI